MKKKILWADDDFYAINGLLRPLEREGFCIHIAASVLDCYYKAQKWETYDIIIVDLILPLCMDDEDTDIPTAINSWVENSEYSGVGLVKWLTKEMKVKCPILILSVVDDPLARFQLQENKSINFLSKKGLLPSRVKQEVLSLIGNES